MKSVCFVNCELDTNDMQLVKLTVSLMTPSKRMVVISVTKRAMRDSEVRVWWRAFGVSPSHLQVSKFARNALEGNIEFKLKLFKTEKV